MPVKAFIDTNVVIYALGPDSVIPESAMSEILFHAEHAPEGGYTARAPGNSIFTQADTLPELHERVRDAVHCHFDKGIMPKVIRLHIVQEEVLTV